MLGRRLRREEEKKLKIHPYANPFGKIQFQYKNDSLSSLNNENGELFKSINGQQLHLILKEENQINYYHFSPGTDTRVASIDIDQIGFCNNLLIAFWWSPEEIIFALHNLDTKKTVDARGVISNKKYRIGNDGSIYQVGDANIFISQISIYISGKYILQNTALNTWNETLESVKIMLSFFNEDNTREMVLVNISLVMLVTGLEAYTKRRFIETFYEGNEVDIDSLIESCRTKGNKESCNLNSLEDEAKDNNVSCLETLVNRKYLNFQNYEDIKKAYKKGYGIQNKELGISEELITKLKQFIRFRHKIVHVAPMTLILNQENVPEEEAIFPKMEIAYDAIQVFSEFINKLHIATLKIGRNS